MKEISENLEHYGTAIDRPDIVVKVFHQKVQEFKELVIKRGVLRKCIKGRVSALLGEYKERSYSRVSGVSAHPIYIGMAF